MQSVIRVGGREEPHRNVPILRPSKILDREGRTIVENYPSFSALLLRILSAT